MQEESQHKTLIKLSILPVMFAIGAISYAYITHNFQIGEKKQESYSIVFDAGSTGTRVSIFYFVMYKQEGDQYKVLLEREVFHSVEPGISSYTQNLSEISSSLKPLLNTAIKTVDSEHQSTTPINFKATAGLRLLPKYKADAILKEVKHFLIKSPFLIPDESKTMILSGIEEGLFAWVTVNYLLDLIWNDKLDNSVTTFDLGGGSTQIAFEISKKREAETLSCSIPLLVSTRLLYEKKLLNGLNWKDVYKISFGRSPEFHVFTKSFLGFGLKSARLGILGGKESQNGNIEYDPNRTEMLSSGEILMFTPCLHSEQRYNMSHGDSVFYIQGTNGDENVLTECQKVVDSYVRSAQFVQSEELSKREINLFSYFFDVARWAKMIPWQDSHEVLRVEDYFKAAQKYCCRKNVTTKRPFLCIDLLYIHSLLTVGIGLNPDKLLHVETKIKGKEVSWSLGAALSNYFTYSLL